jgi:hypothetical protein
VSQPGTVAPALHTLMERSIDYAGLFPPASLGMEDAVRAYAEYRAGTDSWALGRFILPASRLEEFDVAGVRWLPTTAADSWALSALLGRDVEAELAVIETYNARHRDARLGAVQVDTVELKASSPEGVLAAGEHVSGRFDAFIEVPVEPDPALLIDAIARIGVKAKIRTGGVSGDAFPSAEQLVRFMRRCNERGVSFKATAGLHHAMRGEYRLTYAADSPRGVMFGFLNLFVAEALMRHGAMDATVRQALETSGHDEIRFEGEHVRWRDHWLEASALRSARSGAVAFGSCSFREPVDDLRVLGLL